MVLDSLILQRPPPRAGTQVPVPTSLEGSGEGVVRAEGGEPRSVAGCQAAGAATGPGPEEAREVVGQSPLLLTSPSLLFVFVVVLIIKVTAVFKKRKLRL